MRTESQFVKNKKILKSFLWFTLVHKMLESTYELFNEELDSLAVFFRRLNREIIPRTVMCFSNRPRYDVSEFEFSYILSMELPGLKSKDIQVGLANHDTILTISGLKDEKNVDKLLQNIRKERKYYAFTRNIDIPIDSDIDRLKAQFEDGVLKIEIPKKSESPAENVKKIEIDE